MAELANGVPQEGEEVSDAQAEEGGEEEQEATLIKKSMKLESQLDEDAANKENVDDKTEDQVPDITNNEDPMTTSMDGIEEISANEDAVKEVPVEIMNGGDAVENGVEKAGDEEEAAAGGGGAEDENTEKDVAEIPVNVYEEEAEKPAEEAEPQPEADAEAEAPAEPEAEQPPAEAEEPAAETAAEEPAAEEAKPEEEAEPNEVEEEPFELQAPPVPKRPRTPNEMDEPQADEEQEEAPLAESEQPATEEQPAMADVPIEVEGLPSTPKSVGSIPIEVEGLPSSPKSGSRRGSGGSALSAGGKGGPGTPKEPSIASPVPDTPKSGGTTTPKSTRSGKGAFDFGIEPAGKRSGSKKTTFEDEVLSVKSSKSRSPRSPRSPRARKSAPEPEPPAEEAPNAEEPAADAQEPAEADATSEDEKIRQASLDRLKEREEEEQRWKRMTSWDKSEDGDNKAPPTAPEPAIEEEKSEAGAVEEEAPAEAETDQQPPAELEDQQEAPAEDAAAEESAPAEEAAAEDQKPAAEAVAAEGEEVSEAQEKAPSAAEGGEVEGSPPPPPPRPERSPSPVSYRREPTARSGSDYRAYDQDLKTEQVPAQMTANESFSSWAPVERESYKPISPWVDRTSKYRNEYTVGEPPVAPSAYTAFFDDMVSSGPFASSLYSTSRLLERSRSRTRERRQAMRSQSQARNYFRYASQNPAPLRSRDYSTPPSSMVSRAPTSPGSFVSFMDYAGQKQYEMARSQSLRRTPLYQSNLALSRSISRGGVDYYLGSGRSSRVDSYVDSMHRPYEYNVPSNYEMYRASSRGQVGYAPLNHYQSYVDTLQRSLSRERYERDRLRNKYTTVSYQLEQACKQMDLLRSSNYSALRSGSAPRTSVYANFYPYF